MDPVPPSVLDLISGWRWFSYATPEARRWLADRASIERVAKGQLVYSSGMPATAIYGVMNGLFRIYVTSTRGEDITLEEVVRGGWFPHMAPVENPRYIGNCLCLEDSTVAAIPVPVLAEFTQRHPAFFRGQYHEFIDRMGVIIGRIELLSLHNLDVRLAVYFLRMAHLRGVTNADGSIWIAAHDNQTEIGARVGGTRQRVNTILKAWAEKGMIELQKDGTLIRDVAGLTFEAKRTGFELEHYLAGWHGGWQGTK
jgi:CRP/FNR family cyclic AMP-dependent transcriptional regulator